MRRIQTALGVGLLFLILASGHALAAPAAPSTAAPGPFNVTVSPDAQNLVTQPGTPVSTNFQIRNNGLQTEHLSVTVMTFDESGPTGIPQLVKPTPQDDFIPWLSLSSTMIDAEPNVWQTFPVTIKPPKTAAFGYYYALVFSRVGQPAAKGNTIVGSVVGLILLDVKAPGELRRASLAEFSTPNKVIEFLPENFTVRMHNTGNVHVAPRGNIFIYRGKTVIGLVEVNIAEGNILPNSYREYTAQWTDGTPVYQINRATATSAKKANDTTTLSWSNFKVSKLRFGKYTAKLEMIYNDGEADVPVIASLSFWVIPWRIIIAVVVVALLVIAGIWALLIRPIRSRLKKGRRGNGQAL